jgi:16S rRNA (uracil1498-N3)-methyltransferase
VIEASKQCGRNRLMEVAEPQELGDYVAGAPTNAIRWIAHPEASACQGPIGNTPQGDPEQRPVYLAVGPEGGFTPGELGLARASCWQTVDLGARTLRVETAAVALAAVAAVARAVND